MPTFYEVYQGYLKHPLAIQLPKGKYKILHQRVKLYYDRLNDAQPLEYREVEENGEKFNVRVYPAEFVRKMNRLIIVFSEKYKANLLMNEANQKKKAEHVAIEEPPKKKERKRIPAKPKSIFTVK